MTKEDKVEVQLVRTETTGSCFKTQSTMFVCSGFCKVFGVRLAFN